MTALAGALALAVAASAVAIYTSARKARRAQAGDAWLPRDVHAQLERLRRETKP